MTPVRQRKPLFGTTADKKEAAISLGGSLLLTLLYTTIARELDTTTSALEFWSLVFSFSCVWLSRTENIYSMHAGIVSSVCMGTFLLQIELVGQGWIQFVYYIPIQLYGWWAWCRGGEQKTELPVTRLNQKNWVLTISGFAAIWLGTRILFGAIYEDPQYIWWDTSIVAASIAAQSLMTLKKVESWVFWFFPVNVSSIVLYLYTDVPAFAVMYTVFLANAAWGWRQWTKSHKKDFS
jgi:nicotinamide mononucleotide transporter